MIMLVIDATDRVMGRLASLTAKKLLEGEQIVIVNAGDAVMTGNPAFIKGKYLAAKQRGDRKKGPFIHRAPDALLRRAVRGMLPQKWKKRKGTVAYKRLRVFADCPEEYKKLKKFGKGLSEVRCKFMRLKEISKFLGAKGV